MRMNYSLYLVADVSRTEYKDYNWGKEWDKAPFIIIVATKESEVSL